MHWFGDRFSSCLLLVAACIHLCQASLDHDVLWLIGAFDGAIHGNHSHEITPLDGSIDFTPRIFWVNLCTFHSKCWVRKDWQQIIKLSAEVVVPKLIRAQNKSGIRESWGSVCLLICFSMSTTQQCFPSASNPVSFCSFHSALLPLDHSKVRWKTPFERYSVFLSYASFMCKTAIEQPQMPFSNASLSVCQSYADIKVGGCRALTPQVRVASQTHFPCGRTDLEGPAFLVQRGSSGTVWKVFMNRILRSYPNLIREPTSTQSNLV